MLTGSELWLLRLMADRGLALLDAGSLLMVIEERGELRVAAASGESTPRLRIVPVEGSAQERAAIAHFIEEQTCGLRCPVLAGFEAGHGSAHFTIPLGVRTRLDSRRGKLSLLEAAVSAST